MLEISTPVEELPTVRLERQLEMRISQLVSIIAALTKTPATIWAFLWLVSLVAIAFCCLAIARRVVHGVALARSPRYYMSTESFWHETNNKARYCALLPDITEGTALLVLACLASCAAWTIGDVALPAQLPFTAHLLWPSWLAMVASIGLYGTNRGIAWGVYRYELRAVALEAHRLWLEDHEPLSPAEQAAVRAFAEQTTALELLSRATDEVLAMAIEDVPAAILQAADDQQALANYDEGFKLTGG